MIFLLLLFVFTLQSDYALKEYRGRTGCDKKNKMVFHQYIKKGVCFNFEDSYQKYQDGEEGVLIEFYNTKEDCEKEVKKYDDIDFPLNVHLMTEGYCRTYEKVTGEQSFANERPAVLGKNEIIETIYDSDNCRGNVVSQYWSKIDYEYCKDRNEELDTPFGSSQCEQYDEDHSIFYEDGPCVEEKPFDWESFLLYVLIVGSIIGIILVLVLCFLSIALVFMEKNEEKKAAETTEEGESSVTASEQDTDTDYKTSDLDSTDESSDLGTTTESD